MTRTWGKRSAPLVLLTAGFLTFGSGVASADISVGPVTVPADGVNVNVASDSGGHQSSSKSGGSSSSSSDSSGSSSASEASGGSSSGGSGGGSGTARTLAAPVQEPQQEDEGGVGSGNDVTVDPDVDVDICGNDITILGDSSTECGGGEVPPGEQPPGEQPPGEVPPAEEPPGEVPPAQAPPAQERPAPEGQGVVSAAAGEELPFTGFDAGSLVALAVALLVAGAACVAVSSRRVRVGRW